MKTGKNDNVENAEMVFSCERSFYSFGSKLLSTTIQVHAIDLNKHDKTTNLFDQQRLILGNYDGIDFPVVFKQEDGNRWHDIIDTGWPSLFLISSEFRDFLIGNSFRGWKTFEVEVLDKKNNLIKGYYGMSVTGRCGKIYFDRSEIVEKKFSEQGTVGKYYKGIHFNINEWDGSHFFIPVDYFGIFISGQVVTSLKKFKFTNINIENVQNIETPF